MKKIEQLSDASWQYKLIKRINQIIDAVNFLLKKEEREVNRMEDEEIIYVDMLIEEGIVEYFRKEALKTLGPTVKNLINDILRDYVSKQSKGE